MKPELMSHKDLLNRVKVLEEQNAVLVFMLSKIDELFNEYMPLVMEQTDKAIVEHKKRAVA